MCGRLGDSGAKLQPDATSAVVGPRRKQQMRISAENVHWVFESMWEKARRFGGGWLQLLRPTLVQEYQVIFVATQALRADADATATRKSINE